MAGSTLIILIVLFFATSVVGVVTGSNSLITVPVMFQFGIDEKRAVATNMFGLVFMAIGGTIPFMRRGAIDYRKISPLVILTIVSSAIGALLVGFITNNGIKLIVSIAMIAVVIFTIVKRGPGANSSPPFKGGVAASRGRGGSLTSVTTKANLITYALVFLLGIYGGLYSGGYVTVLTAVLAAFFGMTFMESIAATKFINVFSSLIAAVIFMWQELVDYKLGMILGITMFAGAYAGAHFAAKMNELWLKRIFLGTVFLLAIKTLVDFL